MLLCSSAGNDILFDESQVEQGRNFANKIWNAYRLVLGWEVDENAEQSEHSALAVEWFRAKLNKTIEQIDDHFNKFRLSDSLMTAYKFFWDDFCAWYLEIIKPAYQTKIDGATYKATVEFFDALLKILHPYMPFITEELWQNLEERAAGDTIMLKDMPAGGEYSEELLATFDVAAQAIMNIRNIRQSKGISPKESLELYVKAPYANSMKSIIVKLANVTKVEVVEEFDSNVNGTDFMVSTTNFFVPLNDHINVEEEVAKMEADIAYLEKFLKGVNAKLANEKFVANAPEKVLEIEKKKQLDATTKIAALQERIASLKK